MEFLIKESSIHANSNWSVRLTSNRAHYGQGDLQSNVRSATGRRASDKGLLSIRLDDYLQLLDFTGRQLRTDNKGTIPGHLDPILKRLEINTEHWTDAVRHFHTWFGSVVGAPAQVAQRAAEVGRSWYRGQPRCAAVFG